MECRERRSRPERGQGESSSGQDVTLHAVNNHLLHVTNSSRDHTGSQLRIQANTSSTRIPFQIVNSLWVFQSLGVRSSTPSNTRHTPRMLFSERLSRGI